MAQPSPIISPGLPVYGDSSPPSVTEHPFRTVDIFQNEVKVALKTLPSQFSLRAWPQPIAETIHFRPQPILRN